MGDRLTQLQDCLDDLLDQMYSSLSYIRLHHPYGELPNQPSQAPALPNGTTTSTHQPSQQSQSQSQPPAPPSTPPPDSRPVFTAALHEIARDIVTKEQQVEYLINSLPGIGSSEKDQERRIRELEGELREVERERGEAEAVRRRLVGVLGGEVVGVGKEG